MKSSVLAIGLLAFALPFTAGAAVKKEGAWPSSEKKVDLAFDGKPSDGLKKLAHEAGWSLVLMNGEAVNRDGDVHVAVEEQPADLVLDALFSAHDVVAHRAGNFITVRDSAGAAVPVPPAAAAPPVPPIPPVPPAAPATRGDDQNVIGGSRVIGANETVHTVTVAGGSLKIRGNVTGDLVIAGGSAKLEHGAHVFGNATVFGGSLKVEKGARIDGDVGITGGALKREDGAIIGGKVVDHDNDDDDDEVIAKGPIRIDTSEAKTKTSTFMERVHEFGESVTRMALLFVLGCVLLSLVAPRMDRLRLEIASRPMRSFALGIVGLFGGTIAVAIAAAVLCVTLIGIPIAVLGILLLVLAVYGSIAAALTTFGAAVSGHRTQNQYVHLLVGCGAFLVLSSLPWVGGVVTFVVGMIALGALVATRGGGLFDRKGKVLSHAI